MKTAIASREAGRSGCEPATGTATGAAVILTLAAVILGCGEEGPAEADGTSEVGWW